MSVKSRATMSIERTSFFSRVRREKFPGVQEWEIHGNLLNPLRDLPRQQQKRGKFGPIFKIPC
jgi:hypothetical protein